MIDDFLNCVCIFFVVNNFGLNMSFFSKLKFFFNFLFKKFECILVEVVVGFDGFFMLFIMSFY